MMKKYGRVIGYGQFNDVAFLVQATFYNHWLYFQILHHG